MTAARSTSPLILLVEDSSPIRSAFAILLEESGYRVAQAANGAEALDRARGELPDLILMDLGLPDIGGLEVTQRLKADPETSRAPVVALTGRATDADVDRCLAAGCSGYLSKPITTAELLAAIPGYLG